MEQIQQGDVILRRVDSIPDGVEEIQRGADGFVLAEGEVTGHAHRVRDDIRLFREKDGTMYLKADKPFTLLHEEHKAITYAGRVLSRPCARDGPLGRDRTHSLRLTVQGPAGCKRMPAVPSGGRWGKIDLDEYP